MQRRTRWLIGLLGLVLVAAGLACLNYTKAATWERHRRWAIESDAPAPGRAIFVGGLTAVVLGGGLIGSALLWRSRAGQTGRAP